jgi:hypothetical protein
MQMIEILEQSTGNCLVVRFSKKVTGADYQKFSEGIAERMKEDHKLNLVIELSGFEFYGDLEAVKMDSKFGFGEYNHIHRAAYVGDQKWNTWFTRLVGPFTRAEEKHFPGDQLHEAVRWTCQQL